MLKQRLMKHSLYVTLGSIIIATVMLVLSIHLAISHIQITERLTTELKTDAHHTAKSLAKNLSPFIESYAVAEYETLVKNETQHKDLLAIIVSDHKMAEINDQRDYKTGFVQIQPNQFIEYDPNNPNQTHALNNSYFSDIHKIYSDSGDVIGDITLYVSNQKIEQAHNTLLVDSAINMLIIVFSLTLLLFVTIRDFLLKPLSKTISLIEQTDETGIPTQEIEVSGPREMTQLSQTINTMLQAIKASKAALEESEFRWKFAVDGSGDGLWDWQIETGTVYYSPQWKKLLKCPPEANVDNVTDWKNRLHPDDYQMVLDNMEQYIQGKTHRFDSEHRMICDDGQILWVHDRGIVVKRTQNGKPVRMIGTISDISDRIQAQQELKHAHRINKLIIETIPDLLWLKDNEGRYLLCNSKFEQFFGAKKEKIIGNTDYDFVDQELADSFREHDRHAMMAGKAVRNKVQLTFASNGYTGLFEATKVPLVSDENQVIGILGIGHDITELDQLIHQLNETKQLLLSLVNAIPFFIYRLDLEGRFTFANKAFSAYLQQSPESLVGQNFYQIVPTAWAKECQDEDQHLIETRTPLHKTKSLSSTGQTNNHPQPQYLEIIKLPIFDFNQQIIGIQGILWDVTENILSKQALEHSAKHDSLTGLPNRYLFNELIQTVMHRCDRNNHLMALLYLDLDGFKEVNDNLGHEAGDQVLIDIAHPLKAALIRKEDIVARLGGDEFVIAIADLKSKQEIIPILERLHTDLHLSIPCEKNGISEQLEVTASIGVSFYPQSRPISFDELLRQADDAMYAAKNTGKNRYFFYENIQPSPE